MKKTIILLGLGLSLSAQAQIKFEQGSWADVKAKAKKESKMIFIDAYTTWCGPCKMLDTRTFKDSTVGIYHNANYVNYKMDMEKGEGVEFAKTYKVTAYPTMLYFNSEGELAHRMMGFLPPDRFLPKTKEALKPEKQYYTMLHKYEIGERGLTFLRNLFVLSEDAGAENTSEIAQAICTHLKKEDWGNPENSAIILKSATSFDSEVFQYIEANRDKFSAEGVKMAVYGLLDQEFRKIVDAKDEKGMRNLQDKVTKYLPEESTTINPKIESIFKQMTNKQTTPQAQTEDWRSLNEKAWACYEKETDKTKLTEALGWAKKSIEMEENYYNTDTYAHLAYKLGKKEEALKYANRALELGKASGDDTSGTQELLKLIKKK